MGIKEIESVFFYEFEFDQCNLSNHPMKNLEIPILSKNYICSLLKPRLPDSNKGDYGHALIVAGNESKMGAAVIASKACLRCGVGLLTVNVPEQERFILQTVLPEAMILLRENNDYDFSRYSAIGFGPAIGTTNVEKSILVKILSDLKIKPLPLIFDADALNIISVNKDLVSQLPPKTVLSPHPKEFDRLFGIHDNVESRHLTAIHQAQKLDCIIILKGHQTLITSGTESFLNTTGNAGLAKGGSGDALTGMITAFLAQGYDAFGAAKIGVFLHGLAADITLQEQSFESMLITDVINNLGKAFKAVNNDSLNF